MAVFRAKLVSWSSGTWRAVVRLDGSAAQVLSDVRVSRAIPAAEMVAGRPVLLDTGDHGDSADIVLTSVWA